MTERWLRPDFRMPLLLGLCSAAVALAPSPAGKALMALPLAAAGIFWWSLLKPDRWFLVFFAVLLLAPPMPFPLGDAGIHPAPAVALVGVLMGMLRLHDWRTTFPPVAVALFGFTAILLSSVGCAALYSGPEIAMGSLFRVGLFAIGVYVFAYALRGPRGLSDDPLKLVRFLFVISILAGIFGCIDYYYQLPAPAGFGAQFVWLEEGVFRRAQGLFYEASTLGNFCAFFLVMIAVALFRPHGQAPCSKPLLAVGGLVFGAALILSYSRASVLNVSVACLTFMLLRKGHIAKTMITAFSVIAVAVFAVATALPSFFAAYLFRLSTSVQYLWYAPDGMLSGRLTHWQVVVDFLLREPWHAIFGVGYKTLPYSTFIGTTVITDNTWLSLLAETGIIGLAGFAVLNFLILRSGLHAARSSNPRAAFFGEWIFCFWMGELAQMFSGDLITYWRVLPLYFWVLATAVRESEEAL